MTNTFVIFWFCFTLKFSMYRLHSLCRVLRPHLLVLPIFHIREWKIKDQLIFSHFFQNLFENHFLNTQLDEFCSYSASLLPLTWLLLLYRDGFDWFEAPEICDFDEFLRCRTSFTPWHINKNFNSAINSSLNEICQRKTNWNWLKIFFSGELWICEAHSIANRKKTGLAKIVHEKHSHWVCNMTTLTLWRLDAR